MKRKLLKWGIWLLVILLVCGAVFLMPSGSRVSYGIEKGSVDFTDVEFDITDSVLGAEEYLAAKNERFELYLDSKANITVRDIVSGKSWSAVSSDAEYSEEKYSSSLNLAFYDNNAQTALYSSSDAVDKGQFKVSSTDKGVRVEYVFGEISEDFVFPEQISETRMKEYLKKMSAEDADYIDRRYTLYSVELTDSANREYLLSQYPRLKDENLYVLTDASNNTMKKKIDEIFRSVGYTYEDRDKDNSGNGSEAENPKSFRVAIDYVLTKTGFKASIDPENIEFYRDYPISELELMPNFSSFCGGESGYYVVPAGSGALISVDPNETAKDSTYSLSVYGQNSAVTRKLDTQDSICTLPVFGQYKDGKGFLCVIEKGAEQAQLLFKRTSPYVTGCAAFTVIDNGIYQMKSKTNTTLFSSEASLEGISAEYILISDTSEEGAYSEMAGIYRERLKEEGVLSDKVPASSPKLLAELIGSVEYNTHFLGVIPSQKEFALTDYEQMSDIAKELNSTVGEGNLTCLISGWNKNGLNAQKPGTVSLSGALGSKSGFTKLINAFRDNKISYFVNLEFVSANPARLFGYSSFSQSARSLNNGIVKLSYLDSVSCQWEESGRQLISSRRYMKISDSYSKKADGFDGIGVSELSSMLYGDYSNSETVTRAQSSRAVEETLSSLCESHRLIGNGGNLYALEYLSFVDGLSEIPQEYTFSRRIPFVQMVLHGYIPYTSRGMNSEEDSRTALLKRIEYGENLRYTLTANSFDKLYETDFSFLSNTRYSGLKADIDENYKALSKALDGLMDKEIVSHRALSDSVVRVEYEGGSEIYVNYGDADYTAEGITVNAKDFLRK